MRRRLLISATLAALSPALFAQGPAFDVVSIKPNKTNEGLAIVAVQPGGRVIAGNVVVPQMILTAYGLEDVQLLNTPVRELRTRSVRLQPDPVMRTS
jgi:hypothetical protein